MIDEDIEVKKLKALLRIADVKLPPKLAILSLNEQEYRIYMSQKQQDLRDYKKTLIFTCEPQLHGKEIHDLRKFFRDILPSFNFVFIYSEAQIFELDRVIKSGILDPYNDYVLTFCHEKKHFIKRKLNKNVLDGVYCENHFSETNVYTDIHNIEKLFEILNDHILSIPQ